MLGIITSRTRRQYGRKPSWPYTVNWGSPQAQGLVHWWPGDPSGANTLFDLVRGQNGTLTSGATWRPGTVGHTSLSLDGSDDYVEVGDYSTLDFASAFTLTAWINPSSTQVSPDSAIISKNGSNPYPGYMLWYNSNTVDLYIDTSTRVDSATTISSNTWTHVAGGWNGANVYIYINGVISATAAYAVAPTSAGQPFRIGMYRYIDARNFTGLIDDVRAYNKAAPASTLRAMYDPSTRWDLYYQPGRRAVFLPAAVSGGPWPWHMDNGMSGGLWHGGM